MTYDYGKDMERWNPADKPPEGTPGCWSRAVVVVTMSGEAYRMSYFWSDIAGEQGRWQMPKLLAESDKPLWWTEMPNETRSARLPDSTDTKSYGT